VIGREKKRWSKPADGNSTGEVRYCGEWREI
jgi:hypothetical protein